MDSIILLIWSSALQHTRLPQCTIDKAHKWNAFFCPNVQVSQLLINPHKLKHEVAKNSLLILYIFDVFSMT